MLVNSFIPTYNAATLHNHNTSNNMRIEYQVATTLIRQRKTMSAAESCTGGLLAHTMTNISGSSMFFHLGIVAYDNAAKTQLLKIPATTIETYGAVSTEVATLMAKNVRKIIKTDIGIGVTGIAGPTGGSPGKPVGLTYIAIDDGKRTICKEFKFTGSRLAVKEKALTATLRLVLVILTPTKTLV